MRIRPEAAAVAAALAASTVACGTARLDVLDPGADSGASLLPDGAPAPPPPSSDGGVSSADYCSGKGSPVLSTARDGGAAGSACVGGLAQGAFRYALCTCEGLVSATSITTDSFDSDAGAYDPAHAKAGGGVGTNGNLNAQGTLAIGGALWVSDVTGMSVATASAHGELHVGGPASIGPKLTVGADAYVLGDLTAQGDVSISGTLHQPAGRALSVSGAKSIGGTAQGSFTVPPACDCDPALLVDVPSFVEAYRAANDDAALGIDPRLLENVTTDLTQTLACGRIFFTRVGGTAAVHLTMTGGRSAILVGGDLAPSGAFTIDVAPGSEVDVFVEGNVVAGGAFTLGSASSPVAARLWVGGNGTINLQNAATLAGNVYAPLAELVLGTATTTLFGSAFVRRLSAQGPVVIHYDEAVLAQGSACPASPGTCSSCHDCGNQACVAGTCGSCTDSSQCCAPLVCQAGSCVAEIP